MENSELITIWKAQNEKLEKTLAINQKLLKENINQKAKSTLRGLVRLKTAGIVAFMLYLLVLGFVVFIAIANYSSAFNYFIVSVAAIFLINFKGFSDYIRIIVLVNNIDYNGSIMEIQQQLSRLQLSIINHAKIMWLQLPFFSTFYLSNTWFPQDSAAGYIILQVAVTGSLIYLSYWLYKNHKPENLDKKWFRTMISGSGGKSVADALEFYKELEDFKQEKQ